VVADTGVHLTQVIDGVVSVGGQQFVTSLLLSVCMSCLGYVERVEVSHTMATDLEGPQHTNDLTSVDKQCRINPRVESSEWSSTSHPTHTQSYHSPDSKKSRTFFLDEIAGNMSNRCTFINPNSPQTSHMKNELQHE